MRTFCDRTNLNHFDDILEMVSPFLYMCANMCAKKFGSSVGLPENLVAILRIII